MTVARLTRFYGDTSETRGLVPMRQAAKSAEPARALITVAPRQRKRPVGEPEEIERTGTVDRLAGTSGETGRAGHHPESPDAIAVKTKLLSSEANCDIRPYPRTLVLTGRSLRRPPVH